MVSCDDRQTGFGIWGSRCRVEQLHACIGPRFRVTRDNVVEKSSGGYNPSAWGGAMMVTPAQHGVKGVF